MTKTTTCDTCGRLAQIVRRDYPFAEMGIPVELQGIEVLVCPECGDSPMIPNMDGLMHTLAIAIISNPNKLCGADVKFLRKYVGKSAAEFSRFLHVDPTHLSKIENNKHEIGPGLDRLVRLLVANMSHELRETIEGLLEAMPNIGDSCKADRRLVIDRAGRGHYQYA